MSQLDSGFSAVAILLFLTLVVGWRWRPRRHTEDPLVVLVKDAGFLGPRSHVEGTDYHETYSRGSDVVDILLDDHPVVKVEIDGHKAITWRLSTAAVADIIRAHPEVLRGDLRALLAADAAARSAPKP